MMGEVMLTKDADALICVLYKTYLERRKSGMAKPDAKMFHGPEYIHQNLLTKWTVDDIEETCRELSREGMVTCEYGDDRIWFVTLNDRGIVYMETRFVSGLAAVISYLEKILSFIPG